MTKQKSGADEKIGPTRGRAAKIASGAAIPPAEESVSPVEETISRIVVEQAAAGTAPVLAEAAPLVVEAASEEVAPAQAPELAEVPTQIVLLAGEAEAKSREEPSAFSWSERNLNFWKENAQAFYRLAEELGAARTPGEIMEAQTKFAVERLRAFGRHAEAAATVRVNFFFAA